MSSKSITFREYKFHPEFPFLYMQINQTSRGIEFIHFHNCLEIALCEKGTMVWNMENKEFFIHPGDFCFLPPFFTHASFFPAIQDSDVLCHYLFFNPEDLLAPLFPNGLPQDFLWYRYYSFPNAFSGDRYPQLLFLLKKMVREAQKKENFYQQEIRGLAEFLLAALRRCLNSLDPLPDSYRSRTLSAIFPAVSYIDKNYQQEISPLLLAQMCGITNRQLTQNFQDALGKTPLQYIRQVKVQKACHLLTRTEDSILQIAYTVGFSSVTSFNRSFVQVMGKSPSVFRNEKRSIRKHQTRHALYTET